MTYTFFLIGKGRQGRKEFGRFESDDESVGDRAESTPREEETYQALTGNYFYLTNVMNLDNDSIYRIQTILLSIEHSSNTLVCYVLVLN